MSSNFTRYPYPNNHTNLDLSVLSYVARHPPCGHLESSSAFHLLGDLDLVTLPLAPPKRAHSVLRGLVAGRDTEQQDLTSTPVLPAPGWSHTCSRAQTAFLLDVLGCPALLSSWEPVLSNCWKAFSTLEVLVALGDTQMMG